MESYEDLIVWQKAYQLVLDMYRITKDFPADERFGLVQQMRRAAVSIPSNIAEGWGRGTRKDYTRFVEMARGSSYELQTQLRIASDLGYMRHDDPIHDLISEVEKLANGLVRSLKQERRGTSPA